MLSFEESPSRTGRFSRGGHGPAATPVQPDDLSPRCSRRGCGERARWRPFVYVPIARFVPDEEGEAAGGLGYVAEQGLAIVPLPMLVCAKHKLPHRIEEELKRSRRFRKLLAQSVAERGADWIVRIDRAWVSHERNEDVPARS